MKVMCLNCGGPRDGNGGRKLCRQCYNSPVRALYPKLRRDEVNFAALGHGAFMGGGFRLAEEATSAPPGSAEKIAEMERRASRGEAIFHPRDSVLRLTADGVEKGVYEDGL